MGRPVASAIDVATAQFSDKRWRLNNLYWITDEKGNRVKFRMNAAQESLFENMHYLNLILKARQLGFTTFIQIYMLDECIFNSNVEAGTIAHTLPDAEKIFKRKVKYPYDNLPAGLRDKLSAREDTKHVLTFANNSTMSVSTSYRSGTVQYLHISEYGKICAKYPEKAEEIQTGALQALHAGQIGWIESTAEGNEGDFFRRCQDAQNLAKLGRPLTPLDWKFFFFAWFQDPKNTLSPTDAGHVVVTDADEAYFTKVMAATGCSLSRGQKAWYCKKKADLGDRVKKEHPSTPQEAFEAAIEGAYYATQMMRVREQGRIGFVPWEPSLSVNTFWDIGMDDMTTIWFHQRYRQENRFIDFYRYHGAGVDHYARILAEKGYVYGKHYMPHDVEVREFGATGGRSRKEAAESLGIRPIVVVPRIDRIEDGREAVRQVLGSCFFDERKCAEGISDLDNYRRDWDTKLMVWSSQHRKDIHVHGADSFRQFAQGYSPDDEAAGSLGAPHVDISQPYDDTPASFEAV